MPTYSYKCTNPECEHVFSDFVLAMVNEERNECPICKSIANKTFSCGGNVLISGKGFYQEKKVR